MTRKIISVVLSLCMVMSCFVFSGISASAASATDNTSASAPDASGDQYAQSEIQGSNVLHCFNWTYNNITANLADIAAAGYTAVQTSPVQQPKDYSSSYTIMTDEWWKLYQPLNLDVAASGTTYLGSPADLSNLCTAADSYGIKVIVDIVANHVANNGSDGGGYSKVNSAVDSSLKDAQYYHSDTNYVSYDSRYNITQRHLGMPDLNTGNSYIQQKAYGLLKDCVDLGVDGFRFDAAKHIEVPNDNSSFSSNFWPNVIGQIKSYKSDVYVYGEILGDALIDISNYTQYMSVTEDSASGKARSGASSGSASSLAYSNYDKGAGASKSVLWVESHDNYMNDGSSSIDDSKIIQAWAITGARADATSLFLARPNSVMGRASSNTSWKNPVVAEVNKFKNVFDGTSEYLAYSGKVAYIERGSQGVVISKLNGAGSVSLTAHQIASGTYTDQITGNTFTVKNGTISGTVGSSGVAVVYNTDDEIDTTKGYYLFGYINGANYACEEDSENMGTYKFTNGKLTTTFNQTSYVAVKESNNANWYMTNGYPGDNVKSAVLYNTSVIGNNSNKLYVPGGVEVTFTLTDNGNDTFNLSYTTSSPATTAASTTVAPTTAPVSTVNVYLKPNAEWLQDNARFAVYAFNNYGYDWFDMTKLADGNYTAAIPGDYPNIIFCRMNPSVSENNWSNKWTQTGDLLVADGNGKIYTMNSGSWTQGMWKSYTPPVETTAAPTTVEPTDTNLSDGYYLIKSDWAVSSVTQNDKFSLNTAASETEYMLDTTLAQGEQIKVVKIEDGVISVWYPDGYGTEYTVDANHAGNTTIYFKPTLQSDWENFGGYFYVTPVAEPTTVEPTTVEPTTVEPTTKPFDTVDDGYYLIKNDWSTVDAANAFTINQWASSTEYMLDTTLAQGDQIKVVKVENDAITEWYPDGYGTEYTVDAAHAGNVTIYFKPTLQSEWENFGGYFYIGVNEQPVTEEPTTEPVTNPDTEITIKAVIPDSYLQGYKWNSVDLYYTNKGKYAEADHLAMTKTDDVYYVNTANDNIKSIVNASGWSVYSITLTPEQVATLDSSRLVGFSAGNNLSRTKFASANNIFKAAIGAYGSYKSTAASVASFDGCTFVICDSLGTDAAAYTAYTGYWTEGYTTVKFAAPVADTMRSTWDNVSFCYGDSYENSTAVAMANTLETTKVTDVGDMSTLKPGRWYIFAATLDAAQTEAANTSAYAGFVKPGDTNRTAPSKNVLKALTNEFTGTYGSARTLQELEGQVFMVKANATATSLLTFNGEWETEDVYTAHNSDTVTIYFVAPTADKDSGAWNTGVELYYTLNNSTDYKTAERIEMTKLNNVKYDADLTGTNLKAINSGEWDFYEVELSEEQIVAIDQSNNVGFIKKGSYNRTSILYTKNITKASKTEDHTYSTKKQTIEAFDGFVFMIDSCTDTANERTSYTGYWVAV